MTSQETSSTYFRGVVSQGPLLSGLLNGQDKGPARRRRSLESAVPEEEFLGAVESLKEEIEEIRRPKGTRDNPARSCKDLMLCNRNHGDGMACSLPPGSPLGFEISARGEVERVKRDAGAQFFRARAVFTPNRSGEPGLAIRRSKRVSQLDAS